MVDAIIALGAEEDFEFSVDDLEATDEQLDGVPGGIEVAIVDSGVTGEKLRIKRRSTRLI